MSKAITGAALLVGAVAAGVALDVLSGGTLTALEFEVLSYTMEALAVTGMAMEAGAIGDALTSNRGMNITTRQSAACRQIIYGQRRVGGVMVYKSTTGSSHDQMNYVIVLAGHECQSIQNLYLDGRQVHWQGSGIGYSVRNGVGFGGIANGNTYTGPDGLQYNFGGTGHSGIYCEARYGDQASGDVMTSLTANDPNWAPDGAGNSPWVGGCTYVYLKIEYNTTVFPNEPEIRFTVNGKNNIYDPRTGTSGFSQNWALCAADVITDTVFGLGDNTVNQAQLIAAANVCDEQVTLGVAPGTLTEARYTTNYNYDTSVSPGNALSVMLGGAAGRVSRIGGQWFLWPAYWQGPSASFQEGDLTGDPQWKPYRSVRDLVNRVNGTYIAPTYPYNIAGNLYDSNGFYNGRTQNNFPFAYQPTNFPQYASDSLHGYASDQWLNEDDGFEHPQELTLHTVLSVAQAQRVAKIVLLRNRQQGSGTFEMDLASFVMQPTDVMAFTFVANGWTAKTLEVVGVNFKVGATSEGSPRIGCTVKVIETDPSVYEWSTTEELTVYDVPAAPSQTPMTPDAPTSMTLISSAGTAVVGADGSVTPRIEVQWNTPFDVLTKQIQIQYQLVGASVWLSAPSVDVSLNLGFISGVIAGQPYNVRIRSARANGVFSAWTEISGYVVSITLPIAFGLQPLVQGSLIGEAPTSGTADIVVPPFTATSGSVSVSVLPAGPYVITGLTQDTLYYVYYVDPTFAGGAITPIATTNTADFLGKTGYYLISSVVTPSYIVGAGNFGPSSFTEQGNSSTVNPRYAFDGIPSTSAIINSRTPTTSGAPGTVGECLFTGFPNTTLSYATTLDITAAFATANSAPCSLVVSFGGMTSTLFSTTVGVASTTYTVTIPSNINLSTVSVQVIANGAAGTATSTPQSVSVTVTEIWIPYTNSPAILGSDTTALQPLAYTGMSNNQVPNGTFLLGNIDGWLTIRGADGYYGPGPQLIIPPGSGMCAPSFNVIPGQIYRFVYQAWSITGTQSVYFRIQGQATYEPNVWVNQTYSNDFLAAGSIYVGGIPGQSYVYDWTCPAGINFVSMQVYNNGSPTMSIGYVSAQDYGAAAQWGADKTGSNTAAGIAGQGALATLDQTNTTNIIVGAVNVAVSSITTSLQTIPPTTPTQSVFSTVTIATVGGYVMLDVVMLLSSSGTPTTETYHIYRGDGSGNIIGSALTTNANIYIPEIAGAPTITAVMQYLDTAPGVTQQYLVVVDSNFSGGVCNYISFTATNVKV